MDMDGQLRPALVEPPRVDREALAADLLRNITADVGGKIVDWPAKMVAGHIHALIEATLGPAFPALAPAAAVAPVAPTAEVPVTEAGPTDAERAVVAAAKAWGNTTPLCSCESTEEGRALLDAIMALDATPTPAPEAKRPTWVRIVKSASPSRFKDGDVLRVAGWLDDTPSVDIDCYMGGPYVLYDSKWEPATPPAPVPPVDTVREAERAVVESGKKYQALIAAARRAVGRVDTLGSVGSLEELREVLGDLGVHIPRPTPPAGGESGGA